MSNPAKRNFMEVLEQGASVDNMFKDAPKPKGSNPFYDEMPIQQKLDVVMKLMPLINKDSLPFGVLISEILTVAMSQVSSEGGSFIEVDYENKCLFFRAVTGASSKDLLNFTVPLGQGVAGFVCEMQQPMVLSNMEDSSAYLKSISDSVGFNTKNMVAYPIIIRGKTFGCIELLNRKEQDQFTETDQALMVSICEIAAIIIENRLLLAHYSKLAFESEKIEVAA